MSGDGQCVLPSDPCSQVNHHVRNSLMAVVYYTNLVMDKARYLGNQELLDLEADMKATVVRMETALRTCDGCAEKYAGRILGLKNPGPDAGDAPPLIATLSASGDRETREG